MFSLFFKSVLPICLESGTFNLFPPAKATVRDGIGPVAFRFRPAGFLAEAAHATAAPKVVLGLELVPGAAEPKPVGRRRVEVTKASLLSCCILALPLPATPRTALAFDPFRIDSW